MKISSEINAKADQFDSCLLLRTLGFCKDKFGVEIFQKSIALSEVVPSIVRINWEVLDGFSYQLSTFGRVFSGLRLELAKTRSGGERRIRHWAGRAALEIIVHAVALQPRSSRGSGGSGAAGDAARARAMGAIVRSHPISDRVGGLAVGYRSRSARLRSALRARLTAAARSRARFSDGFS